MLVGPLKNSPQISVIINLITSLVLCVFIFSIDCNTIQPPNYSIHILYQYLFGAIASGYVKKALLALVILIGAFLLNFIAVNQEIIAKNNFIPAFFYTLFAYAASTKYVIEPVLLANIFLLCSIYYLLDSYRQDHLLAVFFNTGFCAGLATFFYAYNLILIPILFIAMLILRTFVWREWILLLLGIITPLYIYNALTYLSNTPTINLLSVVNAAIANAHKIHLSEYFIAMFLIVIMLMVFAIFHNFKSGFGNKVKTQKAKYILFWWLGCSLFLLFFEHTTEMNFLPCIIPLSIILGDYFGEIRKIKIANTLLLLFIVSFLLFISKAF